MNKKWYLSPSVRVVSLDMDCLLLTSNDQKALFKVDPIDEIYFDGDDGEYSDYLIDF